MQSNLQQKPNLINVMEIIEPVASARKKLMLLPSLKHGYSTVSDRQQRLMIGIYLGICALAILLVSTMDANGIRAFALGMFLPGSGFLYWAGMENPAQIFAILSFAGTQAIFAISIVVWMGTGNVLLPPLIWFGAAVGAANGGSYLWQGKPETLWTSAIIFVPLAVTLMLVTIFGASIYLRHRGHKKRVHVNKYLASSDALLMRPASAIADQGDELSKDDLQLMRLILDRALQPVDRFDGFEWIDQYQTSAVRYQLNFMSYALSMAQAVHLPAFAGYLNIAQENLATKQQNHRIWSYWKLENMWGNLRRDEDPIPHENIMYSGFVAAQLAYHQNVSGMRNYDAAGSFTCSHPSGRNYVYSLPKIVECLAAQYGDAKYGLLACEPNWIYPLCNFITASAIRAHDAANETSFWGEIEGPFRRHLETEFIRPDGQLVPFRSSYTGIAVPRVGGAIMQAFPCMFLNSIAPDIAERQWAIFRRSLKGRDMKKAFWPVDVGNYKFSRATSYAATAAAAVELGDGELANELLENLDDECPRQISEGVAHRANASLWAHSVELMARCGRANTLQRMVTPPAVKNSNAPFIKDAKYPDVLVAKAISKDGVLLSVLYPGNQAGFKALTIGGLVPERSYIARCCNGGNTFSANASGEAILNISIKGRTELRVLPTV